MTGNGQRETLSAWAEAVVRFRPLLVLQTVVRRLYGQALAHLDHPDDQHGGIGAWETGTLAVYVAGHAASELWSAGRHSDAGAIATQLEEHAAGLLAVTQDGPADNTWAKRLADYTASALAGCRTAQASALVKCGQYDDALAVLQALSREVLAEGAEGRQPSGAVLHGHGGNTVFIALKVAIAASREGSGPTGSSGPAPRQSGDADLGSTTEVGEAALAFARELMEALGSPASIVSGDLSSDPERTDRIAKALQERSCHMLIAGLTARSAGQPVTEDLLQDALPGLARPPADQPAGSGIDRSAWAHRDRPAIEYAARLDTAVTGLALLNAAILLNALPAASLRALIVRVTSSLPGLPGQRMDATRVRPHYARYLEMLIDIAARHSSELAGFAGEKIGMATGPNRQGRGEPAANRSSLLRLRQRLGLRLLDHNARVSWLDRAIQDADGEIAASPGGYEHTDALATQVQAHARAGDVLTARELLARVMPESFTPSWSKDSQLKEWIRWLLATEGTNPDTLLAQTTGIAPMLAALTDATDGTAEEAGALLLEGVARIAPQPTVRLAAWQLGQGTLSFTDAHESLLSGIAGALIDAINDKPSTYTQIHEAAALLGAVIAGILAPACRFTPRSALERTAELLRLLEPQHAAAIREQLARAVDIHVLPGIRSDWRQTLGLPSTPATTRDAADEALRRTLEPEADDDERWGKSEFGLFKATDGSMTKPEVVLQSVTDLTSALEWRSKQAEPGTFSWLPALQPLIARARKGQLGQIIDGFRGAYDAARIFMAVAERIEETGDLAMASEVAREAIKAAEPAAWSTNHEDAARRRAWRLLIAHGDESVRREALSDLADLLSSADYWPSQLMYELRKILPAIAPALPAARIWEQVRGHLHEMRTGLTEPGPPDMGGPVRAAWWALSAKAQQPAEALAAYADGLYAHHRLDGASAGAALTDLVIIHLDHPLWAAREGAAAVLAWLLTRGGSLAAGAELRASAILASTDDYPVLATSLSASPEEPPVLGGVAQVSRPGLAVGDPDEGEGLGGDGAREMAARAVAAGASAAQAEPSGSLVAAATSRTWTAVQCARQVRPGLVPAPRFRPLPMAYQLSIPAAPAAGPGPANRDVDMGPYGSRAIELARAAGISPNTVLHRLWRLTELAERRIPDRQARDRAARATRLDGFLSAPRGQALRAAFGAVAGELMAADYLDADDEALSPLLELVDIALVRQPFSPVPGWIPVPVTPKWIPGDQWLAGTTDRLAEYQALLPTAGLGAEPGSPAYVTLTSDVLGGASLEFGPIAAVIGADHEFAITDQGHPTERYLLASTFSRARHDLPDLLPSRIVTPAPSQPMIKMSDAEDWLLSDGAPRHPGGSSPTGTPGGRRLIVKTDSAALQTMAARWICLDPRIAVQHGWRPHPTQPLCWQDAHGNLTAASLIWHRATMDRRRGDHDTVGEGSAVLVTTAGLRVLTSEMDILRTHQVQRIVWNTADDADPAQQAAIAELGWN